MARPEGTDNDTAGGVHSGESDARLTELLRAHTSVAYPALRELRARHRAAVLAYARLCTTGDSAARQLAAQAFTLAARETARGTDPADPWRHQLLLLTGRVAATWAEGDRSAALDAGLLLVLSTAGPDGPPPPMLAAYRTLPARTRGLIWYGVVEQESAERTAVLLGVTREDVTYGIEPALGALSRSLLRARLAASDDPNCQDFRRLIEESVRPDSPRHSPDLVAHMAHCPHCTTAYEELTALRDTPRTALAEGLLPWAGAAYAARTTGEPDADGRVVRERASAPSRRVALASAGLGVALAPLVFFLLSPGDSPAENTSNRISAPPPPAVTVTATVMPTPASPSPSPSPSKSAKSPSPTASPSPSRTARPPKPSPTPPPPATYPPGSAYAQVVNVVSGLCLDIDGDPGNGTDVVTATCTSSRDQRWRVDSERGVVQSYAYPDYCLDSRGALDRGIGIWDCDSVYGRNGQNLRFAVDSRGVIRPGIAPDHAVTPGQDDSLFLAREAGRADQRWRAGAA